MIYSCARGGIIHLMLMCSVVVFPVDESLHGGLV